MIELKVISPVKEVLSKDVDLVELPGSLSRFEVLKDHAPLISSLTKGVIRYVKDGKEESIEIESGFVEVKNNTVTVCIE